MPRFQGMSVIDPVVRVLLEEALQAFAALGRAGLTGMERKWKREDIERAFVSNVVFLVASRRRAAQLARLAAIPRTGWRHDVPLSPRGPR